MLAWTRWIWWRSLCQWGGSVHRGWGGATGMMMRDTHCEREVYRVDTCCLMVMAELRMIGVDEMNMVMNK